MSRNLPGQGTAPIITDHRSRLEALELAGGSAYNRRRAKASPPVPAASVYRTANQGIADAVETTVAFTAARWDTDGIWNGAGGLVCRTPGLYLVSASTFWATDDTGQRVLHIKVGSTAIIDTHQTVTANGVGPGQSAARSYRLAVGDVVTLTVLQQTTAPFGPQTLNLLASGNYSPELAIAWLGP